MKNLIKNQNITLAIVLVVTLIVGYLFSLIPIPGTNTARLNNSFDVAKNTRRSAGRYVGNNLTLRYGICDNKNKIL